MVDVEENDTGVFVFEDLNACSEELTKEIEKYPYKVVVLGLDCEWVSRASERREVEEESPVCPIALLQLAFPHGRCFLIRLCQMNARLPDKLRDILEDRKILKTGVGIGEDSKRLSSCYGLVVQGCVDLRHVASRCRGYLQHCVGEGHGMSLSALSQEILGLTLDKDLQIRCSNWEAPSLSERQIEYAANDAIVAVNILFTLVASKLREKEERIEDGNTTADDNSSNSQAVLEDNSCSSEAVLLEPEANSEIPETEVKMGAQCTESSSADEIEKRVLGKDNVFIFDEDSPERTSIKSEIPKTEINMGVQCTESSSVDEIEKRVLGKDNVFIFDEDSPERTSINSENSDSREIEKRVLESSEKPIPDEDSTESTSISSESGILSGLLSKLSGFSLDLIFGTPAEPKDRSKSKVYSQYPSFENLEVTEELLSSSELWSCLSPLCQGVVDVPFKVKPKQKNSKAQSNEKSKQESSTQARNKVSGSKTRKAPENGVIDDLDGEMPSTCDKRTACCRKLGEGNKCVVCGLDGYHLRKNVVPRDYMKHFPKCMKERHSHDVLVLCRTCHMISTRHDDMLREKLAEKHKAPLGNQASSQAARLVEDPELKKVKSAAKALVTAGEKIPAKRREELYSTVKAFFKGENPTDEMLVRAAKMETRRENCDFISHGREVVRKVKEGGDLLNFERKWREHFLESMKPKYLPSSWTVDHEHEKLKRLLEEELKSEENSTYDDH